MPLTALEWTGHKLWFTDFLLKSCSNRKQIRNGNRNNKTLRQYCLFVYDYSARRQKHTNRKKHEQYEDRTDRHTTNNTTDDIAVNTSVLSECDNMILSFTETKRSSIQCTVIDSYG